MEKIFKAVTNYSPITTMQLVGAVRLTVDAPNKEFGLPDEVAVSEAKACSS